MSYNRQSVFSIVASFFMVVAGVLLFQHNTQESMENTIEYIQQDFLLQRENINSLVQLMQESRQDKREVERKLDELRYELEEARYEKQKLEREKEQTIKQLKYEIRQLERMRVRLDSISPMESRYRSEAKRSWSRHLQDED